MLKRPAPWMAAAALIVGTLTACNEGQLPTEVTLDSPLESFSADVIDASLVDSDPIATGATLYTNGSGARLVTTESFEGGTVTTAIVGPSGGTISAGDHSIEIPRNAVRAPTEFTMEVRAGTNIVVDLSARTVSSGEVVSVFPVPLTLSLSYRGVLKNSDAKRLRNVYLYLDSPSYLLPLPSFLDKANKTLSSPVWHFSQYGMAIE